MPRPTPRHCRTPWMTPQLNSRYALARRAVGSVAWSWPGWSWPCSMTPGRALNELTVGLRGVLELEPGAEASSMVVAAAAVAS